MEILIFIKKVLNNYKMLSALKKCVEFANFEIIEVVGKAS